MIKIVAFDLMGVIFKEAHIVRNILYPMLADKYDYDFVKEKYKAYDKGLIDNREFWENFFPNDYAAALLFQEKYLNAFSLDDNFYEVIEYLKNKYRLGVISNLPKDWGDYLIEKYKLNIIFEPLVISSFVACSKPDLPIYQIFQERSGIPFAETLFIDDKAESLLPAESLGMKTVHMDKEFLETKVKADYIINSLLDLKKIL